MAGWTRGAPGLCDVDVPVLSASDRERRELTEHAPVETPAGSTVTLERWTGPKRGGRPPARPDTGPARTERPRPLGEAWTTGAAQRALALEPGCFRYAYRSGHAARRCDVTRSLENLMKTITSVAQTREGAACSLRTSRVDAVALLTEVAVAASPHRKVQSGVRWRRNPASPGILTGQTSTVPLRCFRVTRIAHGKNAQTLSNWHILGTFVRRTPTCVTMSSNRFFENVKLSGHSTRDSESPSQTRRHHLHYPSTPQRTQLHFKEWITCD